jgi:chondroitin-sulfate-ABC endolyase/exolyase
MAAKYFYPLFILLCIPSLMFSQDESFETTVPSYWTTTNGTLSTSKDHYKDGNQSLKWDWSANAVITIENLQGHGLSVSEVLGYYQHFFRMWVYNTSQIPMGNLQIEYYDNTGTKQFYYSFGINFTGWRAATTNYLNEMSGNKTSTNITTMKIKAPASGSGTLFFDYIDFTMPRITERAKDYQLPYIPNIAGDLHWLEMMYYQSLPKTIAATTPTTTELSDLATVKQQYDVMIKGSAPSSSVLADAVTKYNAANISYSNGIIKGQPLFGKDNPDTQNIQVVENFLLTFARDYKYTSSTTSKDYFLNSIRYLLDQGYADGSLMETVHHVGYSFRNIPSAIHLMQAELTTEGLWDQAQKMVEWYSAVDGIWSPDASSSNMDDGITRAVSRLGACLYKSTDAEKVQYLKGYKQYIETFLTLYSKENEGMKVDFTGFHHNTYYPGYTFLAYNSLAQTIGYISQGSYAISANAKSNIKKALLLARVVTEGGNIPNSLSGRNPFSYPPIKNGLKNLGLANPIDATVLKAYNYTYGSDSQTSSYGVETPPSGFWQINFANLGTYRQSSWVANIKGFNKYFWGTEIYSTENRYGRYQSYGALEILYPGGAANTKFNISGWDWNKTPGATIKYLSNTDLVAASGRQDESTGSNFAASLRFDPKTTNYVDGTIEGNYGVFGMDFTQKVLSSTHDASFKFKKSVFCFDGKIICLGSTISSGNGLITTNLFQNYLSATTTSINVDNTAVATFPYNTTLSSTSNHWMLDAAGTGYFIKNGNSIVIDRKNQSSPKETGDGTFTTGNFASAYLSHGTTPNNAGYEYVIVPQTTSADMATFSNNMAATDAVFYQVIQKDQTAHIVKYNTMYGYSLFGSGNYGTSTPIQSNNAPCLIMTKPSGNDLALSFVNPDLNFAANNGSSQASPIVITVNGEWTVKTYSGGVVNASAGIGITTLTIQAKDGLPVDISLSPIPLSIAEVVLNRGISIFPNPTNTILYINKIDDTIEINSITIFDLTGKIMYSKKEAKSIDTTHFIKGIYLLKIETNAGGTFNKKIMVN